LWYEGDRRLKRWSKGKGEKVKISGNQKGDSGAKKRDERFLGAFTGKALTRRTSKLKKGLHEKRLGEEKREDG